MSLPSQQTAPYTDRIRKICGFANQYAKENNELTIQPVHLFHGLIEEGSGLGLLALQQLNVDYLHLPPILERKLKNHGVTDIRKLPLSSGSERVFQHTQHNSKLLNHNHVGSEHLLLGLVFERDKYPAFVLHFMNASYERVYQRIATWQYSVVDCDIGVGLTRCLAR